MHKHDPVPPLPADVPRPVSDLVLAMLAKTPEGRPESAQHVADRADVIRDARVGPGVTDQVTADLPVVPGFPAAAEGHFADPERTRGLHLGNRRLAAAGAGVALCGVAAIVAILLTSGGHPVTTTGDTTSPTSPASQVVPPAEASLHTSQAGGHAPGTNLVTGSQTTKAQSATPTPSQRQSPTPTQDASPRVTPTASGSKSSPSASATTTTPTSSSTTPTTTPSSSSPAALQAAALANEGQLRCRMVWKSARHDTAPAAR